MALLQRLVLAMPSVERQWLVAICLTLALTSGTYLEPHHTTTVNDLQAVILKYTVYEVLRSSFVASLFSLCLPSLTFTLK